MGAATREGPWLTVTKVSKLECSQCGEVKTTFWPQNDREDEKMLREHAREHGGLIR